MPHSRRWHHASVFGIGRRAPLDREQRAVWRCRLELFRRAGKLTALHAEVGHALLRRLGTDGRLDPAHSTLAADTRCGERTVRRALAALRACGLLNWVRRLVRDGWRAEQTSNSYELTTNEPPAFPGVRCGGQVGRASTKLEISSTPTPVLDALSDAREARAALAKVAARRQGEFAASWARRHA
jgi:hypothetical protein